MPLFDGLIEWIGRRQQRQRDLAAGVDADLVRANRKTWRLSGWLLVLALVLIGFQSLIKLRSPFHEIIVGITAVCFVASVILTRWAWVVGAFLDRPEPKKPPSLLKGR
jgi:protein-S-isoprenylcysteine O-methyltransferase Ste14